MQQQKKSVGGSIEQDVLLGAEWLVVVAPPPVKHMPRFRSARMQVGAGARRWHEMMAVRALAPPDARPPLQSPTLCALVPPPIRNGAARTCHLLGQWGTS